jgi:hypothetical protein
VIVADFQKRYLDRIRLLLPDSNLNMHWNFVNTLRACKGEYVATLDGDDDWTDPQKLQRQVGFLDSNPSYSGSCHRTQLVYADGTLGKVYGSYDQQVLELTNTLVTKSPWHPHRSCFGASILSPNGFETSSAVIWRCTR